MNIVLGILSVGAEVSGVLYITI